MKYYWKLLSKSNLFRDYKNKVITCGVWDKYATIIGNNFDKRCFKYHNWGLKWFCHTFWLQHLRTTSATCDKLAPSHVWSTRFEKVLLGELSFIWYELGHFRQDKLFSFNSKHNRLYPRPLIPLKTWFSPMELLGSAIF